MVEDGEFYVRFWGVRGSIACPGPETVRYGGNTACVEVVCGSQRLILDCGTGIRKLGTQLAKDGPLDTDIFLTHTHFDHVCGLPFFAPFFIPGNRFRLFAGHLRPDTTLRQVLIEMMMAPLFPVPPGIFRAEMSYLDFDAGADLNPREGVRIRTAALNHPNRATGYRIEFAGKSVCYVTDTEHGDTGLDAAVVALVAGADLVVYDATYTDAEFPGFRGFGHSTWQEGVRIVQAAGADRLVLFHHDPSHDDAFMDAVAADAAAVRPGTIVAREGMTLVP